MSIVPPSPLVGRATELRTLIDAVTRPPAVVLVEGEAGIGKTRLVRAALDRLPSGDRAVLLGYCHQIREPFPYGQVFEALRDIRGRLPAAHRLNPVTGALRDHLPELDGALPPSPQPLDDPRAERHRVFRAIRALLAAVGPAVLVVEDLHWADDGTLDLLRFLAGQPPQGLAAVATCRRDGATGPPLGRAYRHQPDTTSVVVRLTPLDASGVASLAGVLLERSGRRRCCGSPPMSGSSPRSAPTPPRPAQPHRVLSDRALWDRAPWDRALWDRAAHAALDAASGALAAARLRHADAAAFFARAREAYAALPQPYAAARAAEGEARARLALGDGAAATGFREAAESYGRLGATHDAARCRRVLRDIGVDVPLPRGGRRGAGALSQREREVARLVALGRTNREIADVLFLSTRTVETHVATVLRKLGVRPRTQIAPPA